jgi:hypothetical protein
LWNMYSAALRSARPDGFLAPSFLVNKYHMEYTGPFVSHVAYQKLLATEKVGDLRLDEWLLPTSSVIDPQSASALSRDATPMRVVMLPTDEANLPRESVEIVSDEELRSYFRQLPSGCPRNLHSDVLQMRVRELVTRDQDSHLYVCVERAVPAHFVCLSSFTRPFQSKGGGSQPSGVL